MCVDTFAKEQTSPNDGVVSDVWLTDWKPNLVIRIKYERCP